MNIDQFAKDPLFIGIICVIVSTFLYFYFSRVKERKISIMAFKSVWISSKNLSYKDLSGRKEYKEKNPSTQAHLSKEINLFLDQCQNILLLSEPMAGKTYFSINFLNKLENAYVLIPNADKFDEQYAFIPEAPKSANYKIVFIDDIHSYISAGIIRMPNFIENCIEKGYIVWINTITGPEWDNVKNNFQIKLLNNFQIIIIKSDSMSFS